MSGVIVPVGNVLQRLYGLPLSMQKTFKPMAIQLLRCDNWQDKQKIAWKIATGIEDFWWHKSKPTLIPEKSCTK